jgi:hypothetical protein
MSSPDLTGQRFHRLVAIERAPSGNKGASRWLCKCDCGTLKVIMAQNLKNGSTKACGCMNREKSGFVRHGHAFVGKKTKTYICWESMHRRCNSPSDRSYHRYGGRGIKVCPSWRRFENFLADMGERPIGKSLDRIDNNLGYSPENCRWATASEQAKNRSTTRLITHDGETMCARDWARELGMAYSTFQRHFKHGDPWDMFCGDLGPELSAAYAHDLSKD